MRKPIVAGNWKMNKTAPESKALIDELKPLVADIGDVDVVVAPTAPALAAAAEALSGSAIGLAAQNMHWEADGAYTGEVSADMLLTVGCRYVIIGHSERRTYFGETNETVNKKVKAALAAGLIAIVCVGETLEERDAGSTEAVVKDHVEGGLAGLSADEIGKLVVAYEPVWAIGTGKTASPEQAQDVHAFIRGVLAGLADESTAQAVRLQYGGSVKASNAEELFGKPDIDGGLIGGAALDAESFAAIARAAAVAAA
jgi:triosephosphate isomerase (TIM)